jgi:lipoprotein-anchoring transpeptidase ErfK/SrfK
LVIIAGCQQETSNFNRPVSNANTTTNSAPPPAKSTNTSPQETALTLPILDAFFAQENFAAELKTKLQLTDQQLDQLRTIARQETAKLRENDSDDEYSGKAAAAREEASAKIQSAIGEQKTKDLIGFVNERWNGGGNGTPSGVSVGGVPQDTRIVINTPAFRMDVFADGRLTKSYKIGIGYPEFPLPTGLRKADTIIFNPSWTPPDEPWVESAHSKVKVGEKVPAGSELNPLGPIKIPIGLPSLIHGGKAPAKLGGFASHGCVGLTTPQVEDFAARLGSLSDTSLSKEQIAEYLKHKTETKSVKLARPVQVELRYDTITVEEGKLHIYRDVYERGTTTEENLRSVLSSYGLDFNQLPETKRSEVMNALSMMSRGATGKPVVESGPTKNSSAGKKNTSGRVTSNIKGSKEAVIEIGGLEGKGYPAPVDLDTGAPPKKPPAVRKRR